MSTATRRDAGLALLRITLGLMWLSHALLKILVFTLPGTVEFFVAQGIPGPLAYVVVVAELAGACALLLGFHARLASLLLLPILLGAIAVHAPNGWVFTAAGGGWEYPAFLAIASLVHALAGDGALSFHGARAA
jgi:putative oxidoreductase